MKDQRQWVSQIDRVSSKYRSAKYLVGFIVVIFFFVAGINYVFAADITAQKVVDLANADRANSSLGQLQISDKLTQAAADKAKDMILNDYFAHNSPGGLTPWHWMEKENYDYNYAGENLAMDFTSIDKMNQAWLDSPTHRANILNGKYTEIGVALREGLINGHSTIVVVQMFGSGDKNVQAAIKKNNISENKSLDAKNYFPPLPSGEQANKESAGYSEPVITSPQKNELLSQKEIEIVGRAAPGSQVSLFDNSFRVSESVSDKNGWFRTRLPDLSDGAHIFEAESKMKISGKEDVTNVSEKVGFFVDRSKPQVNYRLYALEGNEGEYILDVSTNKSNCTIGMGGDSVDMGKNKTARLMFSGRQLSATLRVSDQAGNKSVKEIELANYYRGENGLDILKNFAQMISPEKVFAADSGREAMMKNLGISPYQF